MREKQKKREENAKKVKVTVETVLVKLYIIQHRHVEDLPQTV